jgi:hypothetical protein
VAIEDMHPLQWGIFRLKYRRDRRSDLPLESPITFYARYAAEIARKLVVVAKRWRHLKSIVRKVEADPDAKLYKDEALTPVAEEDSDHMELYTQNEAARVAVEREWRVAAKATNGNGAKAQRTNGHTGNGRAAEPHDVPLADAPNEPISPLV